MLFSFNFRTFLANSVQLRCFWCLKSYLWLLCLSLKVVSARPMYFFMSSLTALLTVAMYTSCGVKHSPFRGQLSFFRQLHPNDAVLGFKMIFFLFFMQQIFIKECQEMNFIADLQPVIVWMYRTFGNLLCWDIVLYRI